MILLVRINRKCKESKGKYKSVKKQENEINLLKKLRSSVK